MLYGDFFMSKGIEKYIRENLSIIVKIGGIYLLGVIIGILLFIFTDVKNDYVTIVSEIFEKSKLENFEGINIISNAIKNNLIYIGVLYFSLITIIAPLLICLLVIIKAMITGIYICSIFSIFGVLKGIAVNFISTILPVAFSLSGYIIICTNIIAIFNLISQGEKIELKYIIKHIYFFIISLSLISFSIVLEQLMTSISLGIYMNI